MNPATNSRTNSIQALRIPRFNAIKGPDNLRTWSQTTCASTVFPFQGSMQYKDKAFQRPSNPKTKQSKHWAIQRPKNPKTRRDAYRGPSIRQRHWYSSQVVSPVDLGNQQVMCIFESVESLTQLVTKSLREKPKQTTRITRTPDASKVATDGRPEHAPGMLRMHVFLEHGMSLLTLSLPYYI